MLGQRLGRYEGKREGVADSNEQGSMEWHGCAPSGVNAQLWSGLAGHGGNAGGYWMQPSPDGLRWPGEPLPNDWEHLEDAAVQTRRYA